ncbi:MAG: DUF4153 domain-containing protein [Chloroflexota bacterium]
MIKRPNLLWGVVLLLAWLFDRFFWGAGGLGMNFAVYLTICLAGGFVFLLGNGLKPAFKALWLLLPFFFFAAITLIRREPLALFLAYVFVFVSLGLLTFTYLGGKWFQYGLLDYVKRSFHWMSMSIYQPLVVFYQSQKNRRELLGRFRGLPVKPVLRGILIALPVVMILAGLLSSADAVFGQKLLRVFNLFDLARMPEYIFRLGVVFLIAYALAGTFLYAALHSADEQLADQDAPTIAPFLGFTEAVIVLGSVAVLFLAFVMIQFQYFFGGEVNIGVDGFTYSEYARSGFNELITVAVISLFLVLGLSVATVRQDNRQRLLYSALSVAILSEVIVILVSAYQRLNLAIDWHGFSRLRLYPRVFLIWVGILFAIVIALEIFRRERYFPLAALLAACGFAATLGIFNVDGTIVSHNVFRAVQGKHFNVHHLTMLSADAVPALVDAFNDPSLPAPIHQGIGAATLCYLYADAYHDDVFAERPAFDWRSVTVSRWMAVNALREVRDRFDDYRIVQKPGFVMNVYTPDNQIYECSQ